MRYSGVGIEFVSAVAVFTLVGVWVDRHYGSSPWGVVSGAVLGLIGGTYNLIRESLAAFRPPKEPKKEREEESSDQR